MKSSDDVVCWFCSKRLVTHANADIAGRDDEPQHSRDVSDNTIQTTSPEERHITGLINCTLNIISEEGIQLQQNRNCIEFITPIDTMVSTKYTLASRVKVGSPLFLVLLMTVY